MTVSTTEYIAVAPDSVLSEIKKSEPKACHGQPFLASALPVRVS